MITQISQITEMTLDNILQNFFFQFQTTFSYFVNCKRKVKVRVEWRWCGRVMWLIDIRWCHQQTWQWRATMGTAPIVVVEPRVREEPVGRQSDEPAGQPEPDMEQVFPQGLSPRQPERQSEPPLNDDEQRTPRDRKEQELEHGTCQQWLRWLGEQVSGVADLMDEEQKQKGH